jgi:hypothetical protein
VVFKFLREGVWHNRTQFTAIAFATKLLSHIGRL